MPRILSRLRRKEQEPTPSLVKSGKPLKEALKGLKVAVKKKISKLTKVKTTPSSSPRTITTRYISVPQEPGRSRQSNVQQVPDATTPPSPPVLHLCSPPSLADYHALHRLLMATRFELQQEKRMKSLFTLYVGAMQAREDDAKDELAKALETIQLLQCQLQHQHLPPPELPSSQSTESFSSLSTIPSLSSSRISVAHTSVPVSRGSISSLSTIPSLLSSHFPATASVPMLRDGSTASVASMSSLGSVRERNIVYLRRTFSNIDASFIVSTPKKTAVVTISRSNSRTSFVTNRFSGSPPRRPLNSPASTSSLGSVVTKMRKFVNNESDDISFLPGPQAVAAVNGPTVPLDSTIKGMLDFVNSSTSNIQVVESRLFKLPTSIDETTSPLRIRRAGPKRPMLSQAKFETKATSPVSPAHTAPKTPRKPRQAPATPMKKNGLRSPSARHDEPKISSSRHLSNVFDTPTRRRFECSKMAPTFSTPTSLASWVNANASDITRLATPSPLHRKQVQASFHLSPTRPLRPRGKENVKSSDIMIAQ